MPNFPRRNHFTGKLMMDPPREGESVNDYIMRREEALRRIEEIGEGMRTAEVDAILIAELPDCILIGPAAGEELRALVYGA